MSNTRAYQQRGFVGVCPICKREAKLVADHCHSTGLNREFICGQCNTGLGMFRDDKAALFAAALYLQKHEVMHSFPSEVEATEMRDYERSIGRIA